MNSVYLISSLYIPYYFNAKITNFIFFFLSLDDFLVVDSRKSERSKGSVTEDFAQSNTQALKSFYDDLESLPRNKSRGMFSRTSSINLSMSSGGSGLFYEGESQHPYAHALVSATLDVTILTVFSFQLSLM